MSNFKLLSSRDSANLAGVGIDTIKQYRDLGLLRVQLIDGIEYFEEDDIKLVFNSRRREVQKAVVNEPVTSSIVGHQMEVGAADESVELPTLTSILNKATSACQLEEVKDPKVVRIHAEKVSKSETPNEIEEQELELPPQAIHGEVETSKKNGQNSSYRDSDDLSSIEMLELSRSLKHQLELVLSERDWLRQRVEKLELQLERQQMISMSETETLRMLAKGSEPSPSPWSLLLSWVQPKSK